MKALNVVYYTILRNIRDKNSLIMMIAFPIVLILILGTALDGAFKVSSITKPLVYYVNEDTGTLGRAFDNYIKSSDISDIISVKTPVSIQSAKSEIINGDAEGLIYIGNDYTRNITENKKSQIEVFTSDYSKINSSIINSITASFLTRANTINTIKLKNNTAEYKTYKNIEEMPLSAKGKTPRAVDYYSVTMLVMIIMYGINYGTYAYEEDKLNHTDIRINISPINKVDYLSGKTIGNILTLFFQALIVILFTKYVYKANWNGSIWITLYTCFIISVFAFGFGMLISSLTRDSKLSNVIVNIIVPLFTFISGGYAPIVKGKLIEIISNLSPNTLAQRAMFNNIYGGNPDLIFKSLAALTILSLIVFIILPLTERRKAQ